MAFTHALINKQVQSLGGATMGKSDDEMNRITRMFLYTSDGGSDQSCYRRIRTAQITDDTNSTAYELFFPVDCQQHPEHLVLKSGLVRVDTWCFVNKKKWRYFSGTAMLTHCWRDFSPRLKRIRGGGGVATRNVTVNKKSVQFNVLLTRIILPWPVF